MELACPILIAFGEPACSCFVSYYNNLFINEKLVEHVAENEYHTHYSFEAIYSSHLRIIVFYNFTTILEPLY